MCGIVLACKTKTKMVMRPIGSIHPSKETKRNVLLCTAPIVCTRCRPCNSYDTGIKMHKNIQRAYGTTATSPGSASLRPPIRLSDCKQFPHVSPCKQCDRSDRKQMNSY